MPYALRPIGFLSPTIQLILIVALFIVTTVVHYSEYRSTEKASEYYPTRTSALFAPIYEEIMFRGFVLSGLAAIYSIPVAIIFSSLLFGVWHLKNIFWLPKSALAWQMTYTGIILGPVLAIMTIATGTIWLAVMLHYTNNLSAALSKKFIKNKK